MLILPDFVFRYDSVYLGGKLILEAKTHLASNWQQSWEDTQLLKSLVGDAVFSFWKRSGTIVSFHTATFCFPTPSTFPVTGFKVLPITWVLHLKDLVYAWCTTGMHQLLLSPAPVQYDILLEAWCSSLRRGF